MSRRVSPSFVVSVLALLVALSGTSYAVYQLPRNSVDTAQIKKGAVTTAKISRQAKKALKAQVGPAGPAGPAGSAGSAGPAGAVGPAGPSFADTVRAGSVGVTGCTESAPLSLPLTVTTPSRILATGQGAYARGTSSLNSGLLSVRLRRGGAVVARTSAVIATDSAPESSRLAMVVSAVLATDADLDVPYVAAPGSYLLELVVSASDGTCAGTPSFWYPSLTYMLTGTAP